MNTNLSKNNFSIKKLPKRIYIELNSTHRNREKYEFPAQFDVNVGNSGQKLTANTALDPIALAQPIASFNANEFASITGMMGGVPSAPILDAFTSSVSPVGAILQDDTTSEQTTITSYNIYTGRAEVYPPFSADWRPGDTYSFFNPSISINTTRVFFPGGPSTNGTYVGQLLYNTTTDTYSTIVRYSNNIISTDSLFTGSTTDNFQIQSAKHITTNLVNGVIYTNGFTNTTVRLAATDSSIDDFYTGKFIRVADEISKPPTGADVTAIIVAYNGTTKVATIKCTDISSFSTTHTLRYYIFPFTKDNYSYINYVGLQSNDRALYKISLNSLILPNIILDNQYGGRIAFYPFVYVVFSNKSMGTSSLINSNNPNSGRAVFRVAITDVSNPIVSSFVKLTGKMVNVFEFNPFEDLKFEVYLPDGTLFKTVTQDRPSPGLPNAIVQISCNIALEKIQ